LVAALLLAKDRPDQALNLERQAADTPHQFSDAPAPSTCAHCKPEPQLAEPDTLIELINPEATPN
jgi:hypothetical protein